MEEPGQSRSIASQFRRNYAIVAIVPLVLLFVLVVIGTNMTRKRVEMLIGDVTRELNQDAEVALRDLGEQIVLGKARDVARQMEIYFRMHPDKSIAEMRSDPLFMDLAIQPVGDTGYTAVTEAHTYLFRVHPNSSLNDQDMRQLADEMPSWWQIVENAIDGTETTGYYDWTEPDGSTREKFMATTPVGVPVDGVTIMVSATTYIDEFSAPVADMNTRAATIADDYRDYVAQQWWTFSAVFAAVILLTAAGTYWFGSRAALRYIEPLQRLARAARSFGEDYREVTGVSSITERDDEIGVLGSAFERMSKRMRELFTRLEHQVVQLGETQQALRENEEHVRKLYERSRRQEEIYRSLIHSSADAILITDIEGRATYVSPKFTEIFGWTLDEVEGHMAPYVPASEESKTRGVIADVTERGHAFTAYETRRQTKAGELIDVSISASRFDDHEGRPAGMLAIIRDLSEKKRIEAQMQRMERLEAIGTLAGGLAHDFNNLLMVIQGNVSMLKARLDPSSNDYERLLRIEEQIASGSSLTNQLLGYARKGRYDLRVANLNEAIMETAEAFNRTRKDIGFHYALTEDLAPIEADFYQIEQVLMNLYINASEAMPEGGEIFISTWNMPANYLYFNDASFDGPVVVFSIRDTGSGMDAESMEHIFEPFFTTKEMGRGTGLGLASVYGIVEGHGGHIDVVSTPEVGTTFTIYLPASDKPLEVSGTDQASAESGQGMILLVDDEEIVLDVATEMIRDLGYTVISAETGAKAIRTYRERMDEIDLVVLDMIMPDMGGSVVFDEIKEIDPDAVVLLSTGYSIDDKAAQMLKRGCRGCVQKPYTLERLSEAIRAALSAET